jgi:hypothetical protein
MLLAMSAAIVVGWMLCGGGIHGSVFTPAILGMLLIARAKWGDLLFLRDRRVLSVVRRGLWRRRVDVPLSDLQTVQVDVSSFRQEESTYDLHLVLSGDRRLLLRRAASADALEGDRSRIADFLRQHDLLWGGGDPARASAARAEAAGESDAPTASLGPPPRAPRP